jgi:NADH-quinone oxidoreductase subunit J
MWFEQVFFFIAGAGALAGALGVVILRNPFYSVLALVGHLLSLAVLFLLLHAEFLAAGQVVVYAGAVMVLYIFVVAYIGGEEEPLRPSDSATSTLGPIFAVALGAELCIAFIASGLKALGTRGANIDDATFGAPAQIGDLLLRDFLLPFEAASFLLLVAAVGAIVLARKRRGLDDDDAEERPGEPPGVAPIGAGDTTAAGTPRGLGGAA